MLILFLLFRFLLSIRITINLISQLRNEVLSSFKCTIYVVADDNSNINIFCLYGRKQMTKDSVNMGMLIETEITELLQTNTNFIDRVSL